MNYDVDYFIRKFEAIPEEEIGQGTITAKCALCHVGADLYNATTEALALADLLRPLIPPQSGEAPGIDAVYFINDGIGEAWGAVYTARTPKQRILAALRDIKAKQDIILDAPKPVEKPKVIYRTVVIDSAVKELQEKELSQS